MREKIILIVGLACWSLSAHAGEETKDRSLMPDASMQENTEANTGERTSGYKCHAHFQPDRRLHVAEGL
jgi:hypothetical protein